ncbi:DUF484 family protein [Testudinibacter sp. TR-2022]|uniref:DUF484 family protein n=1 Tax=Testudinibacter sp. TR-2022 TaxID=2585029 RepID=UPI001119977E|nr:DUF484 family protein [Testudinibacter sp. TR-2022]TNH04643.1 DUF484 family protein [Pasteurellaceae bacterium Phil11]TNH25924.1 DUF484 family protein [Testudinibacter sp. TR-2022]TNH26204.1 DUF484 family protein [Testudinibacter sp. TR-2022]
MSEELNASAVADYLYQHPDFFQDYPQLLDQLQVIHRQKGVLSLVEAKLQRQRDQLQRQQQELDTIHKMAEHNERMFFSLLPLQTRFSQAKRLPDGLTILQDWTTALGLQKGTLLLFRDSWVESEEIAAHNWLDRTAFEIIRLERFGLQRHYLGTLTHREKTLLLLPEDFPIGSVALCLLGKRKSRHPYTAVLLFAAKDERHFHRHQETTFLQQLAEMVEQHLDHWLIEKI